MRLFAHGFLLIVMNLLLSCEKKDGYATPPEFVQKEFKLTGSQQTITLTAKNNVNWFLADLTINGEVLPPESWDTDRRINYESSKENGSNSSQEDFFSIYKLEFEDWLVYERVSNKVVKITLTANNGSKSREIGFQASVGNAGDRIHIVQD